MRYEGQCSNNIAVHGRVDVEQIWFQRYAAGGRRLERQSDGRDSSATDVVSYSNFYMINQ